MKPEASTGGALLEQEAGEGLGGPDPSDGGVGAASPATRRRTSWRAALGLVAAGLWAPFVLAAILDHRVRRIPEDVWLWPGLLPGQEVFGDLYSRWFGLLTLAHLLLWTLLARRWPRTAVVVALLFGAIGALRLSVLLAI